MRLLVDTVIALTLVIVLAMIVIAQRNEQKRLGEVAAVQESIRAISSQALYRAATHDAESLSNGYTRFVDASWFEHLPPNLLVGSSATRWIDYPDELGRQRYNPAYIIAEGGQGAFWYNGHRGIVRARVPRLGSDAETVELYNLVNGTSVRVADCRWDLGSVRPGGSVSNQGTTGPTPTPTATPTPANPKSDDEVLQAFGAGKR